MMQLYLNPTNWEVEAIPNLWVFVVVDPLLDLNFFTVLFFGFFSLPLGIVRPEKLNNKYDFEHVGRRMYFLTIPQNLNKIKNKFYVPPPNPDPREAFSSIPLVPNRARRTAHTFSKLTP